MNIGISKYTALKEIFEIEGLFVSWPSKKVSAETYLQLISKPSYNLRELGLCAQSMSILNSKILPDRVKSTKKVCNTLLRRYGLKCCARCGLVYDDSLFFNNEAKQDGKNAYCKSCFNDSVRVYRKFQQACIRASKLERTPSWADLDKIKEIYKSCPIGYHVDHIVPLNGDFVSGLHVEHNLQYLPAIDNCKKSNKFTPG